ncbi:sodium/potassium/calcium exchanger 5-like [Mytilus edulis]|uniref:sodium/potassium/calcium exchanger 5-like n=1 Tax=Mytilus edulis TaxID=6550 RepID=UPI0039F09200
MKRYHGKRNGRYLKLGILVILYTLVVLGTLVYRASGGQHHTHQRHKRDLSEDDDNTTDCIPRSVDNFPGNFFTLEQTQDGGVFLHIFIALYLFGALAIVCDDYFVASLEVICDELKLKEDVAGATFMAAGSSAPEFFTALIGVFISKSDVGVGTIVGSAVFNILFIVGVCALFSGMVVNLTWWPMLRDCVYYIIAVATLVIVIQNGKVYWYEALIMFLLYLGYILIMYWNKDLEEYFERLYRKLRHIPEDPPSQNETQSLTGSQKIGNGVYNTSKDSVKDVEDGKHDEVETSFTGTHESVPHEGHKDSKEYESPWLIPISFPARILWVTMLPVKAILYISIPDCRLPGRWRKMYPLTFIMSVVWIAGFSYVMVWMITIAGDSLGIADTVMGLTILAAGTSVPDCLASLFVSRDGFGDMAVANSIGSNVFDILVCLGLPWLIETAAVNHGDYVKISSEGLIYSSITLLSTVVFLLLAMFFTKWTLSKPFGIVCLSAYVIVITFSVLYELNVFGNFVAEICPR